MLQPQLTASHYLQVVDLLSLPASIDGVTTSDHMFHGKVVISAYIP